MRVCPNQRLKGHGQGLGNVDTMLSFSAMAFSIILSLFLCPLALASPVVKIGNTTLIGRDVTGLKQDFFGGKEQFFDGRCG